MFAALVGLGQRTRAWLLVGSSFHSVKVPWRQEGDDEAAGAREAALHCNAQQPMAPRAGTTPAEHH
jgi:hypothetical protein